MIYDLISDESLGVFTFWPQLKEVAKILYTTFAGITLVIVSRQFLVFISCVFELQYSIQCKHS